MADDPLQTLLDRTTLSKAQRAGLWDLYHTAKNEDDLDARLKAVDLPKDLKADLWDLKATEAPKEKEPQGPKPLPNRITGALPYAINDAGERIDAQGNVIQPGVADKVTALLRGDNPVVNLAVDVLPMLAGVGVARTGAAVAKKTPAAIAKTTPAVARGGAAYMTLKSLGADDTTALAGAAVAATLPFKRRGAPVPSAAVAQEMTALGFPKATGPVESPVELTQRLAAAHRTAQGVPPQGYPSPGSAGGPPVKPYVPTPMPSHAPPELLAPKYRSSGPLPPPDVTPPSGPFEAPAPSYGLGPPLPTPAPRSAPIVAPSATPAARTTTLKGLAQGMKSTRQQEAAMVKRLQDMEVPEEQIVTHVLEWRGLAKADRDNVARQVAQLAAKRATQ